MTKTYGYLFYYIYIISNRTYIGKLNEPFKNLMDYSEKTCRATEKARMLLNTHGGRKYIDLNILRSLDHVKSIEYDGFKRNYHTYCWCIVLYILPRYMS